MIALAGGLVRLLAIARRLLTLLTWLGAIALLAGAYVFSEFATAEEPLAALLLAVVLLAPSLVVLHFVMLVHLVQLRFGAFAPGTLLRTFLAARLLSLGVLMHPVYWVALLASVGACLGVLFLALGVAIF